MKALYLFAAASAMALGSVPVFAEENAVPEPAGASGNSNDQGAGGSVPFRYEAKSKSSFDIADGTRPPFWPVGWVKREVGAVVTKTGPVFKLEEASYTVTSILTGPPALAVINGRAYEEGQFLRVPRSTVEALGNLVPRIRVHRIVDGKVWLSFEDQMISVGLKRQKLNDSMSGEQLLNEDKDYIVPGPAAASPIAPAATPASPAATPAPAQVPAVSRR